MKIKTTKVLIIVLIVLFVLLAGFLLYRYIVSSVTNKFLIKNEYYAFSLRTPEDWIGLEKTLYSEDNIVQFLSQCENDKSLNAPLYEIGAFRFEDKKYPQDFGDGGFLAEDLPSGAILEITISCVPENVRKQNEEYASGILVAGESAFESFLNSSEFGKTAQTSFIHNNFQYKIKEYVYISPSDEGSLGENLRKAYARAFDKIISSFKFVN